MAGAGLCRRAGPWRFGRRRWLWWHGINWSDKNHSGGAVWRGKCRDVSPSIPVKILKIFFWEIEHGKPFEKRSRPLAHRVGHESASRRDRLAAGPALARARARSADEEDQMMAGVMKKMTLEISAHLPPHGEVTEDANGDFVVTGFSEFRPPAFVIFRPPSSRQEQTTETPDPTSDPTKL